MPVARPNATGAHDAGQGGALTYQSSVAMVSAVGGRRDVRMAVRRAGGCYRSGARRGMARGAVDGDEPWASGALARCSRWWLEVTGRRVLEPASRWPPGFAAQCPDDCLRKARVGSDN